MKICHIISKDGEDLYGLFNPAAPDDVVVLEGNLFDGWRITERHVTVGRFLPPVTPVAIFALGFNYGKHAAETGAQAPTAPVVFMKAPTAVVGHGEAIVLPAAGPEKVDYEAELAVVIGRTCKNVKPSEALDAVLGYTCANDVSARDWQMDKARGQNGQWVRGKSFDTFCPLGPVLVTRDELVDPGHLRVRSILNGQVMQDAGTESMIFNVPAIISELSRSMTLLPGTVILTGTPEGVGFTRQPPIFLREGDIIDIEIKGIGRLSNPVRGESPVTAG